MLQIWPCFDSQSSYFMSLKKIFTAALFTIENYWKQLKCSLMGEWSNQVIIFFFSYWFCFWCIILQRTDFSHDEFLCNMDMLTNHLTLSFLTHKWVCYYSTLITKGCCKGDWNNSLNCFAWCQVYNKHSLSSLSYHIEFYCTNSGLNNWLIFRIFLI